MERAPGRQRTDRQKPYAQRRVGRRYMKDEFTQNEKRRTHEGREGRTTSGDARRGGARGRGTNDKGGRPRTRERGKDSARADASPSERAYRVNLLSPDMFVLNEIFPSATSTSDLNDVRM